MILFCMAQSFDHSWLSEYQYITSADHRDVLKYSLHSFRGKLVMIDCYKTPTLIYVGRAEKYCGLGTLNIEKKKHGEKHMEN